MHVLVDKLCDAARRWEDPTFEPRADATAATLALDNTFTIEALDFALDQLMSELTEERLQGWIGETRAPTPGTVAVLSAGNLPGVEFQDWLAVLLTGHRYIGVLSARSNVLLPAFVGTAELGDRTSFSGFDEAIDRSDRLIATGSDETMQIVVRNASAAGLERERILVRGTSSAVAVLSGSESPTELIDLAEDCFLHEGRGCRSVAIVWTPVGMSPDRFLEAAATFRSVFPAHESTAAGLRMPKAMLEAMQTPCAYADDLSFLVSRGGPEFCEPCHVRWTEYSETSEISRWLAGSTGRVQLLATNSGAIAAAASAVTQITRLGTTQRPPIHWRPDGVDTVRWLASG